MERTKVVEKDGNYDKLHFDFKAKYIQAEQDLRMEKTVSKEWSRITCITQEKSNTVGINAMIVRNYNDGRHGGWNNYAPYMKKGKGTYVEAHSIHDKKLGQHKDQLAKHGPERMAE